jgi:hypothetical protein
MFRPIKVVVAIVNDVVHSVYLINGIAEHGTNQNLEAANYQAFEQTQAQVNGRPPVASVRFNGQRFESQYLGEPIRGWTSPYNAVAKPGGKLFYNVEIL